MLHSRISSRAAFTVLELVMVIGVLSILLAVVLPTIKTVRTSALKTRAKAEATALAQAAIRYKNEYGFWPGQLEAGNTEDAVKLRDRFVTTASAPWIPAIISRYGNTGFSVTTSGTDPVYIDENWSYRAFCRVGEKSGETFKSNPLNPKGLHFLDLTNEGDPDRAGYPDPWGNEYILIMGLNPKSSFTYTVTAESGGTPSHSVTVDNTIAFAFSYGPEGRSGTNHIYSAGVER